MGYIDIYEINESPVPEGTDVCAIIGNPVAHSISPAMQNAAFQDMGLNYVYVPFKVKPEDLSQAIRGVKALNIRGLNVTMPHKVEIIPFLDELDPLAENIGAVNTIVNDSGWLKGYNTDASGFLKALLSEGIKPEKKNVVILGAGGAARAIAFILLDKGSNLTILNRHLDLAKRLADRIFQLFRREVIALELGRENLKESLSAADILINTTSVGMTPENDNTPVPARLLKSKLVVFDIIYNPIKTRLLYEAEKKGAKVIGGLEMLVWQGAAAFELWTGRKAPVQVMKNAALKASGSGEN
jgi:shikimate dehydrogenase